MEFPQVSDIPISLLYVDDEPALLEIGKVYLERADGISVTTVENPIDAIRLLADGGFDAIVSDYQMPGMDGIEFLKYVRSTYGDLPFLLFTGKGREEIVIEAIDNGVDHYVEKAGLPEPQFADLVHRVRRAVSRCRTEQILRSTYDKLRTSHEKLADFEKELNHREERIVAVEEALRKSEQMYAGIFAFTGSATAILEDDMTISLVNSAFAEFTGFPKEEIEGRIEWTQFVHPDEHDRLKAYHRSRRHDPASAPEHYEFRFVNRFGDERIVYMTVGLIPGTSRSVSSLIDITEVEENRNRLAFIGNVLDDSQNEIYIIDAGSLRFLEVNRGGRENSGYSIGELTGLTLVDLMEGTDESFRELVAPLLRGEKDLVSLTTSHRRKDGSLYPVEVHLHLSQAISPPVFVAVVIDITSRIEAEEKNHILRYMVDNAPCAITMHDFDGGRFIYANDRMVAMHGYTRDEFSSLCLEDVVVPASATWIEDRNQEVREKGESIFESARRHRDGTVFPVLVYLSLAKWENRDVMLMIAEDITSRREAEEENRILRQMVDNAPCAITIHDCHGRFLYTNERNLAMHGYTHGVFMGLGLQDLDVPTSAARIEAHMQEVKEEGEAIFEAEHYCKDGTTLPLLVHLSKARWGERDVLLSIAEDITEWREVENALRESKRQLSFALEAANDGMWDWNVLSGEVYFSPQYQRMVGYEPGDFITTYDAWREYVHPDDRADVESDLYESAATQKDFYHEFRMRKKDGSYFWTLGRGRVMESDGEGRPVRMVGTLADISRRKRVEEALRRSENQLSFALTAANDGLWDWDVAGDDTYFSPQYQRMLGYEPGEFVTTYDAWVEYVHPDDRADVESALQESVATQADFYREFRMQKKDGSYLWILARGRVMETDSEGKAQRIVGTHTDLSWRKKVEDALRLSNRKLQLLSGITRHDILNQAMALNAYLTLSEEQNSDPVLGGYLQKMQNSASSIERSIAFTREYGQLGLNEPCWLSLHAMLADDGMAGNLTIASSCNKVRVFADPMLETVFFNLMDNTLRHGEGATAVCTSCSHAESGELTIAWEDDGKGVPDALKEKIFARGYGSNTGLGLFLVREILSITGITIHECGTEGEGARFELVVPAGGWREE